MFALASGIGIVCALPAAEPAHSSSTRTHARWRGAVALVVDLAAVGIVAGTLSLLAGFVEGNTGQRPFLIAILAILGLL